MSMTTEVGHIRVRHTRTRLLLYMILTVTTLVGVGVTGTLTDNALQRAGGEQTDMAARLSDDAQVIYQSLAKADTSATGHFLAGTSAQATLRGRYEEAIGQIKERLADAGGLTGGDVSRATNLAAIALQLPVYTGLVDRAERLIAPAKDETANPVEARNAVGPALLGAAYLHEASSYLRTVLLPAAQRLQRDETDNLRDAKGTALWTSVAHIVLLLAAIGGLVLIQWSLARRTRRVLNLGLLGATVLVTVMLGATGWSLRNWPQTDRQLGAIEARLTEQEKLVDAERAALTAYADTYLLLGGTSPFNWEQSLGNFRLNARCGQQETVWCRTYTTSIHQELITGNNDGAVAAALPGGRFAAAFEAVDRDNTTKLAEGAGQIRLMAARVPSAPSRLGLSNVTLCGCAAVAVGLGLWPRIREYL
ncbi:hypothetical protein [Streptosporangium saharense]|uniref:hypothetical protein n=1 Tax=Streptosporangium saharense TaxID=1706840 RepID=UPI00331EB8C9